MTCIRTWLIAGDKTSFLVVIGLVANTHEFIRVPVLVIPAVTHRRLEHSTTDTTRRYITRIPRPLSAPGLCFQPVCVRGVAPRWFSRDCGFRRRFPGRKGIPGGFGAASRRASGNGRAGGDPGPRAGWWKWRGVVVEWAKASAPGRRVAPGRRACQLWLLVAIWPCCWLSPAH